jgi:DUF1707 SHOCT-like domain/Cell wall-active antibiotics response LiaF, C-terminal
MINTNTTEALGQEDRRQQIVEQLSNHYANGILEVEEFERRVEQAQQADTEKELVMLLQDLDPRYQEPVQVVHQQAPTTNLPIRAADATPGRSLVSIFSKVRRGQGWRVPSKLKVYSVMGGTELDLREAVFGPGVTEVKVSALLGNVRIIVPVGMPIEIAGAGIMGRFHDYRDPDQRAEGCAPVLRISGVALMSGVKIQVWLPGETGHEAARRMRQERIQRRLR